MAPQIFIFKYFWVIALFFTLLNTIIFKFRSGKYIKEKPELKEGYDRLILGYGFWMSLPFLIMGFGIVSGNVSNVLAFFRPRDGNPYVLAFFGCIVSEWILTIYWVFFRNGAETLCQYPGFLRGMPSNPTMVKGFTLLCIAGGAVALFMFFSGFNPAPPLVK
jgi:hypothetical protein